MLVWLKTSEWGYPALEAVHIAAIGLLFGALMLFELRVLGLGRALPLVPLARLALPLTLCGFAGAAGSGLLMFATQAGELIANRAFLLKLILIATAAGNAAAFHARGRLATPDGIAKVQVLVSIVLWLAVIACGRAIAYV